MTLLKKIEEFQLTKKDTKKEISDFILSHKSEIAHMTLEDIQKHTYISKSSLVRFAKSLGFTGWKDFIISLLEDIYQEEKYLSTIDPDIPFNSTDNQKEIVEKIARLQIESLQDSLRSLEQSHLLQAAYSIKKANRVVVFGISPNDTLANLFRRRMISIGKVIEICPGHEMGVTAYSLSDKDLAIIISYSGNNPEKDSNTLATLAENDVTILAITSYQTSLLRERADIVLSVSSREQLIHKISSFASEESILFVLNVIYATYFSLDYDKNLDYKRRTVNRLEIKRIFGSK